jgi:hypothetical protein
LRAAAVYGSSRQSKNFQDFLRKGLDEKKRIIKIYRHTVAIAMQIVMASGAISTT